MLAIVLLLSAVLAGASASKMIGIDNLDSAELINLKRLAPHYLRISKELCDLTCAEGQAKVSPEYVVELAREEIDPNPGCVGLCSVFQRSNISARKEALDLFVSLERSLDDCDLNSYNILAKNYILRELLEDEPWSFETRDVLAHYMRKHAKMCRPVHKKRFARRVKNLPEDVVAKLKRAFKEIKANHFGHEPGYGWDYYNLVGMAKPKFTLPTSQKAVQLIGRNLRPAAGEWTAISADQLRPLLDRELFEPCKAFRNELASILDLARIDAKASMADDRANLVELYWKDEEFYLAMVSNRLCAALLAEQEQLYEPLSQAYNELPLQQRV